jgi:hypothetical protein
MTITLDNYLNIVTELEYLMLAYFFSWNFPKRHHFWLRSVPALILSLGLAFLSQNINVGNPIASGTLNYLLLVFFGLADLYVSFKISFSSTLFLGIMAYNVRHLIYLFWQLLNYIVEDSTGNALTGFSPIWIVLGFSSFAVGLPGIIYIYSQITKYPSVVLPPKRIIFFAIFSLLISNLLNMFVITTPLTGTVHYLVYIINIFNILGGVMLVIIMFGFVSQKALETEVASINQMRHEEEKQYEMNKQTIDLINIKCHDLRHQIRALKESGQVVSKEELQSIEDAIRIYDTKMKTGNASLDVILQEKSLICKKNGIVFNCIIDGSALSFVQEGDIYSLFGNIVDNAIESSLNIDNQADRVITLKIKKVANGVFAYEENRYKGDLAFKDGLPISTKGDDRYHGFGMKSIRMMVNNYHGTMKIEATKGVFSISIYFPA